jgi:transcriptional regulator with XRE-family HTH domain
MIIDISIKMENEAQQDRDIDRVIAGRLKALRHERRLTLEALAERSGVSRAMISRIERGEASPTAALLARLCGALQLSMSSFFAAPGGAEPLRRAQDQPLWRDPETGYLRRSVSPPGTASKLDIIEVSFPPGQRIAFPPHPEAEGMLQHLWLFEGQLIVTDGDTVHRLAPGDCLFMPIARAHAFDNPGPGAARYAVLVERP